MNGDNRVNVGDDIALSSWLFRGGPAPVKLSREQVSCTDTDGGKNYTVKGNTNMTNSTGKFSYVDSCSNTQSLNEYYCDVNNIAKRESYTCPNGCENGACKPIGIQPNVCGNGIVERANVEACDDGNKANGDGCSDRCRFEESDSPKKICGDGDGGLNTGVASFANASDGTILTDECVDNSVLYEAECDPNKGGLLDGELINCVNGCTNGACIGNNCRLASASWSVTESAVGQIVSLAVEGSDCADSEVSFEVREKDVISADDPVRVNPSNAKFFNGVANSQWTVEDQLDEGFTKPEYYFIARIVSDPGKDIQSGLLRVV